MYKYIYRVSAVITCNVQAFTIHRTAKSQDYVTGEGLHYSINLGSNFLVKHYFISSDMQAYITSNCVYILLQYRFLVHIQNEYCCGCAIMIACYYWDCLCQRKTQSSKVKVTIT